MKKTWTQQDFNLGLILALASFIAFSIAILLKIPNPYWAPIPIWVVAQPTRGLLLEKAMYRILGTIIGASLSYISLKYIDNIYIEILFLSFVVALGSGVMQIIKGVLTYGIMLIPLTMAIIVFPSILSPEDTLQLAISRVECTFIGVITVTLALFFVTPGNPREAFHLRMKEFAKNLIDFLSTKSHKTQDELLIELKDIDSNIQQINAGLIRSKNEIIQMESFVSSSLSLITLAGPSAIQDEVRDIKSWLEAEKLSDKIPGFNLNNIGLKKEQAKRITQSLEQFLGSLLTLDSKEKTHASSEFYINPLAYHYNWDRFIRYGCLNFLICLVSAVIGVKTQSHFGTLGAMATNIMAIVIASLPNPKKIVPFILKGAALGVLVASSYRLIIQPYIKTDIMLLISVIPFFIFGGLFRTHPKTASIALDFNMLFLLVSQIGMPPTQVKSVMIAAMVICFVTSIVVSVHILLPENNHKTMNKINNKLIERLKNLASSEGGTKWHPFEGRLILKYISYLSPTYLAKKGHTKNLLDLLKLGYIVEDIKRQGQYENLLPINEVTPQTNVEELINKLKINIQ